MIGGQRLRYMVRKLRAIHAFRRTFRNKRLCVVGSAPSLEQHQWGRVIDGYDIVIRFNMATVKGREHAVGSRTDIRFIGLTLRQKWLTYFADVPPHDALWTFDKNARYLRSIQRAFVAIPTELHRHALPLFQRRYPGVYVAAVPTKPPRTGLVFLLLLLLYGKPREVVLYGFSLDEREAYDASYRAKETKSTSAEDRVQAHCDPRDEIAVLKRLSAHGMVTLG
ncbi:MAG: hypothetical protein RLZZ63_331 [Gemmatimonadota bacterium]|jgi:hypothetical protein